MAWPPVQAAPATHSSESLPYGFWFSRRSPGHTTAPQKRRLLGGWRGCRRSARQRVPRQGRARGWGVPCTNALPLTRQGAPQHSAPSSASLALRAGSRPWAGALRGRPRKGFRDGLNKRHTRQHKPDDMPRVTRAAPRLLNRLASRPRQHTGDNRKWLHIETSTNARGHW